LVLHGRSIPLSLGLCVALAAQTAAGQPHEAPPGSALVIIGSAQEYEPPVSLTIRGTTLEVPFSLVARLDKVGDIVVDRYNTSLGHNGALLPQARLAARFNTRRAILPLSILLEYEHDVLTGSTGADPGITADGLPNANGLDHELRKAYGRVSVGYYAHVYAGFMTSHWGLGLVANDGAHGWEPGAANFSDPRGGDRVIRVMLATGPHTGLGLVAAAGYDWVYEDDVVRTGDRASQAFGSVLLGADRPTTVGVYGVYRVQQARGGADLRVGVLDLYGSVKRRAGQLRLAFAIEGAAIVGKTTLGATPEFPEQDILQIGVAARASCGWATYGAILDLLFASGDRNFDDGRQSAFKTDVNYDMGMILYRHVMAAQTGWATVTAADAKLAGYPPSDLDRFPTRGAVSNTVAVFPRLWWRPLFGFEVYGGPLFAFAAVDYADPLSTKLAGGSPRNALGGTPSAYLGTELDAGARMRMILAGTELTLGFEGGLLFSGGALMTADGSGLSTIAGGRASLSYRF